MHFVAYVLYFLIFSLFLPSPFGRVSFLPMSFLLIFYVLFFLILLYLCLLPASFFILWKVVCFIFITHKISGMLGAIIGDIVGSIYEFDNIKTKEFEFFQDGMECTDDSILTVATADWLLNGGDVGHYYARYTFDYPNPMGGYGNMFKIWSVKAISDGVYAPYNSCGNGSAMRVCPVGWVSDDVNTVLSMAKNTALCTHNHLEGVKGAQATALCVLLARIGYTPDDIRNRVECDFGYSLSMPVDELRERYSWLGLDGMGDGGVCQDSVPQAISCALQADSFEDAIRNAVSIGGDSDTIACITGGVAEPLFGIPTEIRKIATSYIPKPFLEIVRRFEDKYGFR